MDYRYRLEQTAEAATQAARHVAETYTAARTLAARALAADGASADTYYAVADAYAFARAEARMFVLALADAESAALRVGDDVADQEMDIDVQTE